MDVATIWASLASSAFVTATVQLLSKYYLDGRLEREKSRLDKVVKDEVSILTASQDRITDRLRTTFSTLNSERAQTIKDLYAKIVRVSIALNFIATENTITEDSARQYGDAMTDLDDFYLVNRIWLPIAKDAEVRELWASFVAFQEDLRLIPHDVPFTGSVKAGLTIAKTATGEALTDVSASFRELLGSEVFA